MPLKISVVVVSRDRAELLSRSIDALINQGLKPTDYEIIIVDDGSSKDDLQGLVEGKKSKFGQIKYVRQNPSGLAAGRNLGAKNSSSPIIAFTDNDCIADKNWLAGILEKFENETVIGVEGKIIPAEPGKPSTGRKLFTNAPQNLGGGKFTGANSAYRKEIIEKAGWYDEKMNFWREDSEFAFRAMDFGDIAFAEDAIIYHPLRKYPPLSTFNYLFALHNEWVCLFRHNSKYFNYIGYSIFRNLFKSLLANGPFVLLIFLLSNNISLSFQFLLAIAIILGLGIYLLYTISSKESIFKLDKNFTFQEIYFLFLTYIKHLIYWEFLIIGFFRAIFIYNRGARR